LASSPISSSSPHPNLRTLEISDRTITTQYSIAHHSGRGHSPIIKAFIDTVRRMTESDRSG
jgi:DNA-binding transcriptional LysR family regulator